MAEYVVISNKLPSPKCEPDVNIPNKVDNIPYWHKESFIRENIDFQSDEAFYVFNVEDVIRKHEKWLELFPRVVPHYAVKANPFPFLLEIMIGLGLSFDCASKFEIETLLRRGANPMNIIYANPCKSKSFIEYSKSVAIDLMTFDNEEELTKIYTLFPAARLLLRIKVDDSCSSIKLGQKFGACSDKVHYLLSKGKLLKLNIIGIAFHLGSGCQSAGPYVSAIKSARIAFDIGLKLGFQMSMLDIGGGWPGSIMSYNATIGDKITSFEEMVPLINQALDKYFPDVSVTIVGEPGRYYSESAFTLITRIISKNIINESIDENLVMYYMNDGVYGSFADAVLDLKQYKPIPLLKNEFQLSLRPMCRSILWGPTCDSYDCIAKDILMPEMNVGEWLMFEDMGSYSLPFTEFGFNGMPSPKYKIFVSDYAEKQLKEMQNWHKINSS